MKKELKIELFTASKSEKNIKFYFSKHNGIHKFHASALQGYYLNEVFLLLRT